MASPLRVVGSSGKSPKPNWKKWLPYAIMGAAAVGLLLQLIRTVLW